MAITASTGLDVLVDLRTVCHALSRSRASIYRDIGRGTFPKPSKAGSSSRWLISELRAVIEAAGPTAA